jgi:hypothetical protein
MNCDVRLQFARLFIIILFECESGQKKNVLPEIKTNCRKKMMTMKATLSAFDLNTARFEEVADKRGNGTSLLMLKFQSVKLQNLTCPASPEFHIPSCGPGEGCSGYVYGIYGFNVFDGLIEEDLAVGGKSAFLVLTDDEMTTPEGFSSANPTNLITHRLNAASNEIEEPLLFSSYSGHEDEDVHTLPTELGGLEVFGIWSQIDEIEPYKFRNEVNFLNIPSMPVLDRTGTYKKDGLPRTVSTIAVVVALFIFLCYRQVVVDDLELPNYLPSDSESDDELE